MSHEKDVARPDWTTLLVEAVEKPGVISTAYSAFWNYSFGNQLLAMWECALRRIEPGPINTFKGWLALGRSVKKGERAITLCMPVIKKCKVSETPIGEAGVPVIATDEGSNGQKPKSKTIFVYRPHWFVLSQTEGKEYASPELPAWNERVALAELNITLIPFEHTDGNCQGYARDRTVAVSPIAALSTKTLIHEIAHVVIGHTAELGGMVDGPLTPRNVREVEAEAVALLCLESLGLPGAEHCRGYIQHWMRDSKIDDATARRIFRAADVILRAGRPTASN